MKQKDLRETLSSSNRASAPCWCVADMVLDHQEASSELDDSVRVKVREALLKRHHHQNEKKKNLIPMVRSITEGTRKQSEPHLIGGDDNSNHRRPFQKKLNGQLSF